MALYPNSFNGQERLQPGGRGETFQSDIPGHRNQGDRINRTNNKLNTSAHDVPNIKYQFDFRLPVLFRYGYAYGYNQMVIPKGRIVAVDPFMDLVDFDMRKQHNTLTLANGGAPVRLRTTSDLYPGSGVTNMVSADATGEVAHNEEKEWGPLSGIAAAYAKNSYRPLKGTNAKALLSEKGFTVDKETGRIKDAEGKFVDHVRPANIPVGMMQRNEYTRDDDALNGMMPGPILTDALVELPWFAFKDKAECNPWGSAYGALTPGTLVKSDENGRIVPSPLSFEDEMSGAEGMSMAEYEAERQQVIGQVYSLNKNMLPEGSARWATWALEDRLNFDEFNPAVYRQNNRRGEDAINNSPHNSTGEYPGYPYDKAYKDNDLHMLASTGRLDNYDFRMNQKYQIDNLGIPGLTDGKNAVITQHDPHTAGRIHFAGEGKDYQDIFFRTLEVDVEDMEIKVGDGTFLPAVVGAQIEVGGTAALELSYADAKQGIIVVKVIDKDALNAHFDAMPEAAEKAIEVQLQYKKRGLAGVPTFMDWDGCVGSVKILLTK